MRDIACAGYVAGCNTQFFTKKPDGNHSLADGQNNIMRRLSFADDVGGSYASMLAFPALGAQFESGHLDTVMCAAAAFGCSLALTLTHGLLRFRSITTRLLPWEVTSASGGTHKSFPGGEAMFQAYNAALGLSSVHFGEDMKARSRPRLVLGTPFAHLAPPSGRPPRTWSSSRKARPTNARAARTRPNPPEPARTRARR